MPELFDRTLPRSASSSRPPSFSMSALGRAAALLLLLVAPAAARAQSCPAVRADCHTTTTDAVPRASLGCDDWFGQSWVSYDLTLGTLSAGGIGYQGGISGSATLSDEFQLHGSPSLPPLTFRALLVLSLSSCVLADYCCHGGSTGWIRRADGVADQRWHQSAPRTCETISDSVEVEITASIGKPFLVQYGLLGGGGEHGSGSASGQLAFRGLPPDVLVTSCHGFTQGGSTPARPTSWGQLKQIYR